MKRRPLNHLCARRGPRTPGRELGGFTLIEVILTLTLAIALIGTVLSFHSRAAATRRRVLDRLDAISAERLVMDRVTNELRGAMTYPFLQFGMQGSSERVTFMTAALPGPAAWAIRKSTDDPIPPEHDLQIVGYRLRIAEDDDGVEYVAGLERTCQKIVAARTAEEGVDITVSLLTDRNWSGGDLPRAVEIAMGREPLPEDTDPADYPHELYRRVIYIPGGAPAPRDTGGGRSPAADDGAAP